MSQYPDAEVLLLEVSSYPGILIYYLLELSVTYYISP